MKLKLQLKSKDLKIITTAVNTFTGEVLQAQDRAQQTHNQARQQPFTVIMQHLAPAIIELFASKLSPVPKASSAHVYDDVDLDAPSSPGPEVDVDSGVDAEVNLGVDPKVNVETNETPQAASAAPDATEEFVYIPGQAGPNCPPNSPLSQGLQIRVLHDPDEARAALQIVHKFIGDAHAIIFKDARNGGLPIDPEEIGKGIKNHLREFSTGAYNRALYRGLVLYRGSLVHAIDSNFPTMPTGEKQAVLVALLSQCNEAMPELVLFYNPSETFENQS